MTVAGVNGSAGGADFVYSGGTVTFAAAPVFGWELSAWEGCLSSGLACVLTVNNDVQVTAHFSQAPRARGYAANPSDESGGRVTVAGAAGNAGGADFAYSGGTVTFYGDAGNRLGGFRLGGGCWGLRCARFGMRGGGEQGFVCDGSLRAACAGDGGCGV